MSKVDHRQSVQTNLVPDRTLKQGDPRDICTRNGLHLHVRSATIDDATHLASLFNHLGDNELGFRFLSGTNRLKPHQIVEMLAIDHRRLEHVLAFVDAIPQPVASLVVASDGAMQLVEVAIVVDRDWHDCGIGSTLLRHAVGKLATPTPRFSASVTGVILNPSWTVPDSIIAESVGALVRNRPAAARAKGYTWFRTTGGRLRVVQRPGPGNALGEVKFDMPNGYRVYLHDTPTKELFAADQRTFSHGCIRVDDALGLAEYLLDGSDWNRARIDAAIGTRRTERIALAPALPVHVVYLTAFADPDGTVHLIDDPYKLDTGGAATISRTRTSSGAQTAHRALQREAA